MKKSVVVNALNRSLTARPARHGIAPVKGGAASLTRR